MERELTRSKTFTVHCIGTDASRVVRAINHNNVITTEKVSKMYRDQLLRKGYKLADLVGLQVDTLCDMWKRHKKWSPFMSKG